MFGDQPPNSTLTPGLRQRIAADLAAGRTVALTGDDLADADVREKLPQLLEQVGSGAALGQGPQVPGYTVLGEIGHGGMSTVYLARHEALGRYVALKIVPNWLGGQARARERLLNEARAMARLSHPNIVTIHDIIDRGDTVAIAMEWIDGLSLSALLRMLPEKPTANDMSVLRASLGTPVAGPNRLEQTPTRTFVRMMLEVARAVHHVHQNKLLHLDIKPSNVLVRRDGTPLLADFGVVREIDLVLTQTRSFAGTPIYAAPEQLRREDAAFGPRTDVYGLGITLYELIARNQPLRQEGLTRLLQDIQSGRIPRLSTRAEVSGDLENIVHKAISPDAAHRYESAAAFADDLEAFLDGRAVSARPLTRLEQLRRWIRAEPWKAAVAAVLLVLLPVSAALGLQVLTQLPKVRANDLRLLRERHAELAQTGFQALLVSNDAAPAQIELLEHAWHEDPDDAQTLVCLVTLQAHDRPKDAIQTIDAAIAHGFDSLSLKQRRERLEQGMRFFTDAQVAELEKRLLDRPDALDRLMLILDRILFERATEQSDALEKLLPTINRAVMEAGPDPLLHGLRTWVAACARNTVALDESRDVMLSRFRANGFVLAWQAYARDEINSAEARRFATEHMRDFPPGSHAELAMRMTLLRSLVSESQWEEVLAATEGMDLKSPQLASFAHTRSLALARLGQIEQATALLPPPDPRHRISDPRWLDVISVIDPTQAREHYERVLADERPPLVLLRNAYYFAGENAEPDLFERVCRIGMRCYPELELFRWGLAGRLWGKAKTAAPGEKKRLDAEARELVRGHPLMRTRIDYFGVFVAWLLTEEKRWNDLLTHCDQWQKYTPESEHYRIHYFRGIARIRLGQREGAWDSLVKHLDLSLPRLQYNDSYFERAYLTIDPTLQPEARNVAQAVTLLGANQFDRTKNEAGVSKGPKANPWFTLIFAEVHFAEGNREEALRLLAIAKELRAKGADCPTAPADLDQRLADAATRYAQ